MDKVLVNVYVPVLGESYDMFIPLRSQLQEVLGLVKTAVEKMTDGAFMPSADNVISYRNDGKILDINLSVYELGIRNGSKLMLI